MSKETSAHMISGFDRSAGDSPVFFVKRLPWNVLPGRWIGGGPGRLQNANFLSF
jgi:hypothetical protein